MTVVVEVAAMMDRRDGGWSVIALFREGLCDEYKNIDCSGGTLRLIDLHGGDEQVTLSWHKNI